MDSHGACASTDNVDTTENALDAVLELPNFAVHAILERLGTSTIKSLHSSCRRVHAYTKGVPSRLKLTNDFPGPHASTSQDLSLRFPSVNDLSVSYPSAHGQLPSLLPGTTHDILLELSQHSPALLANLHHVTLNLQKQQDVPHNVRDLLATATSLTSLHLRSCDASRVHAIWEFNSPAVNTPLPDLTQLVGMSLYQGTSLKSPLCQQHLTKLHVDKPARRSSIGVATLCWKDSDFQALCQLATLKVRCGMLLRRLVRGLQSCGVCCRCCVALQQCMHTHPMLGGHRLVVVQVIHRWRRTPPHLGSAPSALQLATLCTLLLVRRRSPATCPQACCTAAHHFYHALALPPLCIMLWYPSCAGRVSCGAPQKPHHCVQPPTATARTLTTTTTATVAATANSNTPSPHPHAIPHHHRAALICPALTVQ
jgi:hypothetical protein